MSDRAGRPTGSRGWAALALLLGLLLAGPALGLNLLTTYPTQPKAWKVYGKAVQLGASLMGNFTDPSFNDSLLPQSSDTIQLAKKLPEDAVVVAAYVFWSGTTTLSGSADSTAQLTLTDGFTANLVGQCVTKSTNVPSVKHFYCRQEVTSLLAAHPGSNFWNGTYSVGGVQADAAQIYKAGTPGKPNCNTAYCCDYAADPACQAHHASWSMVLVYDTKFSETVQRDVFLYDGFELLDAGPIPATKGDAQIHIDLQGFLVGDPPDAQLSYYVMEGDKHLGNPPQDGDCEKCWDFVSFNGAVLTSGAGNNQPHNIMNSTPELGVDLDTFDVSALLKVGDTTGKFIASSGDGDDTDNQDNTPKVQAQGYGELFLYGYTLLQFNRYTPSFKNPISKLTVNASEAAPGDVLTYTIDLLNTGQLPADTATLKMDQWPPAGTEYVAGSTVVDGKTVSDVGGLSPLQSGLTLGSITHAAGGNSSRKISFKVKVKPVPGVTQIFSFGLVKFTYKGTGVQTYEGDFQTNDVTVKIAAAKLATPLLTVSPQKAEPGATLTYTLALENVTDSAVLLDFVVAAPTEGKLAGTLACQVGGIGPTTKISLDQTGGPAKNGQITAQNLEVKAGAKASCTFQIQLFDLATLQGLGISPVGGHQVKVQGTTNVAGKPGVTDDPTQGGGDDPTVTTLAVPASFASSSKGFADLSPGTPLMPGDEIQFTLTLANAGPGDGAVNLTDPLPAGLTFVSSQSPELSHSGGTVSATAVAVPSGGKKVLQFTAKIPATATPGLTFANVATLSPTDGSAPVVVQTPQIKVEGGADLTGSIKTVQDVNGGAVEPGDTLQFSIVLTNTGKVASGVLQVVDPIDANLEGVTDISGGGSFDAGAGQVLWTVPTLSPGQQVTLLFKAKVKLGVPTGTVVANQATVTGQELPGPTQVQTSVKVQAQPVISLFNDTVTSSSGKFAPGDTITYTLTLQNTGKGAVGKAILSVTLDGLLQGAAATGGGTVAGQTVTWQLGDLAPNAPAVSVTVTAKLPAVVAQGQKISQQAQLTGEGLGAPALSDDPALPGTSDPTVFTVTSAPDLTGALKAATDLNGGLLQGGDTVQFKLTIVNKGNSPASNVVVTDVLAKALVNAQVTGGAFNAATNTATWTIPKLNPNEPVELTLQAQVDKATASGTTIVNQANLTFVEQPTTAQTNTVSLLVQNAPDLAASTKAVSSAVVQAGEAVTWTIVVQNTGNQTATGVVVTDQVPAEVEQVQAVGGTVDGSGVATWQVGTLQPGASQTLTLQGKLKKPLPKGLKVCNQATIKATEVAAPALTSPPGVTPQPGGQPTCLDVDSAAKLVLTKDVEHAQTGTKLNQSTVKPKTPLRYVIRAKNLGNAVAQSVLITDQVPAGVQDVVPLDGGTYNPATGLITWPVAASLGVQPSDELVVRFDATVAVGVDDGAAISNQALVSYQGLAAPIGSDDPTTAAVADPTLLTAASSVDLSQTVLTVADVNGGQARPGDELVWTLTIVNTGDGVAKEVAVVLPIDSRLEALVAGQGGTVAGSVAQWALGDLQPGGKTTVTLQSKLKKPLQNGALVALQAQVSYKSAKAPALSDSDLGTPVKEPTQIQVIAAPDLSTSTWTVQDLNGGLVEPGDNLTFALTLKNTGDGLATQVAAQAQLPAGMLTNVKVQGGTLTGEVAAWTVPLVALSPDGDVTLYLTAQIAAGVPDGTQLQVVAQIPGVAQPKVVSLLVEAKPNFATSTLQAEDESGWVALVGQVAPGHVVRVEVQVVNTGKAQAQNVTVTVPLPVQLGQIALVTPGSVAGQTVTWSLPPLAPGAKALLVAKATVVPGATDGQSLPLTASISATGLAQPQVVQGPVLKVVQKPILKVTKTFEDLTGGHVIPGDGVRFTITVANLGNAPAQGLTITDVVPAGLTNINPGSGGTLAGNTATWSIPVLNPGQTVAVTLEGKISKAAPNGSTIVNQATAKATNSDLATSAPAQVPVAYPTLQVGVALVPEPPAGDPIAPGDVVTLQVNVAVPGTLDASDIRVMAPVDTTIFDVTALQGATWDPQAKVVQWTPETTAALKKLAGGKDITLLAALTVKATAPHGATAKQTAQAREGETGLTWFGNFAQLQVSSQPQVVVRKKVADLNGGQVEPLDVLRYTLEVEAVGKAAAQALQVQDVIDPALEILAAAQGGQIAGTAVSWSTQTTPALQTVLPGQVVTLQVDVRVKAEVGDGTTIANQAQATATALPTPVLSDDPATPVQNDPTVVTVRVASSLGASTKSGKDDDGGVLRPGDTITWRIAVVATAQQAVQNVRLIDTVPAGTDYVPGSTRVNGEVVSDAAGNVLPLVAGLKVASPGGAAGVVQPGLAQAAIVTFQTRVRAQTPEGAVVRNTATVLAQGVAPTQVGPAELTVGPAASLKTLRKLADLQDKNGNGVADVGEDLVFTLLVKNTGAAAADEVLVEDPLPSSVQFLGGGVQVDGVATTDAADADPCEVQVGGADQAGGKILCKLGTLQPGQTRLVTVRARVTSGPVVVNQGQARAKGLALELSDADGDDGNGNQPTLVQVGAGGSLLQVLKAVQDENGGEVQPGDGLRYSVTVRNLGNQVVQNLTLTDVLTAKLLLVGPADTMVLVPPGAQLNITKASATTGATVTVGGLEVRPGEEVVVSIRGQLDPKVKAGETICNSAKVQGLDGVEAASAPACVHVGAMAGELVVAGTVFEDVGPQDGQFQAQRDLTFVNFQVAVVPAEGEQGPSRTALTDAQGRFQIAHVPPGARRVVVRSSTGVVFLDKTVEIGGDGALDLPLKPMGRIYDAQSGVPAAGVRLILRYDAQDPLQPGEPVADEDLPAGQQAQKTDASGAYVFTPKPGRAYRIDVAGAAAGYAFPSLQRAAETGLVLLDGEGFVVEGALPRPGAPDRYLTRFTLQGSKVPPLPRHNHVPVDALQNALRLAVRLTRAEATVGEIVGVTVKLTNGSSLALVADPLTGVGGVEVRSLLPSGLTLVPGTVTATLKSGNGEQKLLLDKTQGPAVAVRRQAVGGQAVGLDLPPGAELTVTLQAAVHANASVGAQDEVLAQAFDTAGAALSHPARAAFRVMADPLFDRAAVLGKVFCDGDGDGRQAAGEAGLPGARIYVDSGYFADSDRHGRLHFVDLTPGTHAFKLDVDTLPPGSQVIGDVTRPLYLSRGLTLPLTYPVRCALEAVGPTRLEVAPAEAVTPTVPGPGAVLIEARLNKLELAIDGRRLAPRYVRAALVTGPERPADLAASPTAVVLPVTAELAVWSEATAGFARYALEIRDVGEAGRIGAVLFESQELGEVGRRVRFRSDDGDPILERLVPGKRYALRVRAETTFGSRAWSAPLPFEVRRARDPAWKPWSLTLRPPRLQLNGHVVQLSGEAATLRILRPADGRLLIGMRSGDGGGRDEFMTLPRLMTGPTPIRPVLEAEPQPVPPPAPRPPEPKAPQPMPAVPPVGPKPAPAPETKAPDKPATPKAVVPPVVPVPPVAPVPPPVPVPAGKSLTLPLRAEGPGLRVGEVVLQPQVRGVTLQAPTVPVPVSGGRVLGRLLLEASGVPAEAQTVAAVLLDAQGKVRLRTRLPLPLPRSFLWDPSEARDLTPGTYGLALEVLLPETGVPDALAGLRTAPVALTLADRDLGLVPAGEPDRHVRATLFDPAGQPTESMVEWLTKTATALKAASDKLAVVTVHDDGPADPKLGDGQARSDKAAATVLKALLAQGVRTDRLIVLGVGNKLADAKGNRDVLGPHRVEVRFRGLTTSSAGSASKPLEIPAGVWVDDVKVLTAANGTVQAQSGKPTRILWQRDAGPALLWQRTFGAPTDRPEPQGTPGQPPPQGQPRPPGGKAEPVTPQDATADVSDFGAELLDALADDNRAIENGKPGKAPATEGLQPVVLAEAVTRELPAAADLQVWLPLEGRELGSTDLSLRGRTRPGNKLTVQGKDITVDSDGGFVATVQLPVGKSTLTIVSTDAKGNKATLERPVVVKDRAFFLLAIAEGSVSHVYAHLAERERDCALDPRDSEGKWCAGTKAGMHDPWTGAAVVGGNRTVQLLGKGAVYFKGRIAGRYLGLDDLKFTGHLDTTRAGPLQDFATNLIDPTRFYPVYGDASEPMQDAKSRGRLYVMVEAKQGKLLAGNFRADVHGLELLRYDRALYGVQVEAQHQAGGFDTRGQAFVASQDRTVARRTDVLRGTGGSLYYLSGRDVVEGTERVHLVIRDKLSGVELARLPQARNNDYTIDFHEGRLVFKSPVSSAVDGPLAIGQGALAGQHLTWLGHPVFVETVYEARGIQTTDSAAFGGQVRESVAGGKVQLGAGYVQEGRGDGNPTYRTVGADATVQLAKNSKASVEYAWSQSQDSVVRASDDGGLSFGAPLGVGGGTAVSGHAVKVAVEADLRDLGLHQASDLPDDTTAAGDVGRLRAYYQWVEAGFQSGGTIAQQGQQKLGLQGAVRAGGSHLLSLRYDGVVADGQPATFGASTTAAPGATGQSSMGPWWGSGNSLESGSFSAWNRHTVGVQDVWRLDSRWSVLGATAFGWADDVQQTGTRSQGHWSQSFTAGAAWKATPRLTLRGDQHVIAGGDPNLVRGAADRLITSLGVDYKIGKNLAITADERLGWGGQNATSAGLRAQLDEQTTGYVQQRLEDTWQTGRPVSATVVGAETRYGADKSTRAWGEYQIDALNAARMNRAVLGVGKRFVLAPGLTLDAGYERQQTFGGSGTGELSRDALSLGGEWLRSDWLKVGTRQEIRLDDAEPSLGGARKLQLLSMTSAQVGLTREITLFGRGNYLRTQNQTTDQLEAEALEATLGGAFRPIHYQWLQVIGKWSKIVELRPSNDNAGAQPRAVKDVLSLEPISELPWNLQASFKLAWMRVEESAVVGHKWLGITRLGWHASDRVDLAGEYRLLWTDHQGPTEAAEAGQHGLLAEVSVKVAQALRIGLGYNFTRFEQAPNGAIEASEGGFFARLIGLY